MAPQTAWCENDFPLGGGLWQSAVPATLTH